MNEFTSQAMPMKMEPHQGPWLLRFMHWLEERRKRKKSSPLVRAMKLAAAPVAVSVVAWFFAEGVYSFSPATQKELMDGHGGAIVGFIGGAIVLICLALTWDEVKSFQNDPPDKAK